MKARRAPAVPLPGPHEALRLELATWEPAAGPDGFEGLVATALAELTGLTFRLARSGSQFGRDAATPMAPFAVAMEAKRYNSNLPLEGLTGKTVLAHFALADRIDVWALAATIELNETTVSTLPAITDERGFAVAFLDWPSTRLPPLGVLLAASKSVVLAWVETHAGAATRQRFETHLAAIEEDSAFEASVADLLDQFAPAIVGVGPLQRANGRWLEDHLQNRRLARTDFAQYAAPLDGDSRTIDRPALTAAINAAVGEAREAQRLVAVLGGEGAGKTWAVLQWWLSQSPRPVLLLSIGRFAGLIDAGAEPLDLLAQLAALQQGLRDEQSVARWRRRFDNWSAYEGEELRFAVLLDGLNETSGKPWASILLKLAPAVQALGGVLIVTCREGYWAREIAQRLGRNEFVSVPVGDYDEEEFARVVGLTRIQVSRLSPDTLEAMHNPRVFTLALNLVGRLERIEDLNVDRLLMEHWRARLEERTDLLAHGDEDFNQLLIAHARELRGTPGAGFDRNQWRGKSGAAMREDGRDYHHDLTEIEEGRFFDSAAGRYTFRPEAQRFALGMLLADEVKTASLADLARAHETVEASIEQVASFDITAEIMLAAITIACNDCHCPDAAIAAMVTAFLSLQNLPERGLAALLPSFAARPAAFLDALEQRPEASEDRFLELLLLGVDRLSIGAAVDERLAQWLSGWSRDAGAWGSPPGRDAMEARHRSGIEERLGALHDQERILFDGLCHEASDPTSLAHVAAALMVGRPQAQLARGIVGYAFATTVAGRHDSPTEALGWAIRSNRLDHGTLLERVRDEIAPLIADGASQVARSAAALALRLTGDVAGDREAEQLSARRRGESRSRFDLVCAADPLDPAAERPANIGDAVNLLANVPPDEVWMHMSATAAQHDLEMVLPALARFEPEPLLYFLNVLISSAATRTGLPLRQLSWHLPALAPLMTDDAADAVRQALERVMADPASAGEDSSMVMAMLVEALLPRLSAAEQLELILSLPDDIPFYLRFLGHAKPLSAEDIERFLDRAIETGERALERVLAFAAVHRVDPTPPIRIALVGLFTHPNASIAASAVHLAAELVDEGLDAAVLATDCPPLDREDWSASLWRRAFAVAAGRRRREDLLEAIPIEHLDWVASEFADASIPFAEAIGDLLARLVEPLRAASPTDAFVQLDLESGHPDGLYRLDDRGEAFETQLEQMQHLTAELNDTPGDRFERRQRLLREQFDAFLRDLAAEDAIAVARRPYAQGLDAIVEREPERVEGWLRRILAVEDERILRQLHNLAVPLARAAAAGMPAFASEVFAHVWKVDPLISVRVGRQRLDLRHLSLFAAAPAAEIGEIRGRSLRSARDDDELGRMVLAAEKCGATIWLDEFITQAAASPLPSEKALAVTIAGLRSTNGVSDAILARDWSTGFLGDTARQARARYERAKWAAHWLAQAASANGPQDFWRYLELGLAAADGRALTALDPDLVQRWHDLGGELFHRLEKAAKREGEERAKTLYGGKKPTGIVGQLLAAARLFPNDQTGERPSV